MLDHSEPRFRSIDLTPIAEQKNELNSREPRIVTNPFLLLLGPSAVGKTDIINHLIKQTGDRYTYIKPYTTRQLREGETDKIHIEPEIFNQMQAKGLFAAVNNLYENSYGTPKSAITNALNRGQIPLLDYPLNRVNQLDLPQDVEPIFVYVMPPSIETWYQRMAEANRVSTPRLKTGYRELQTLITSPDSNHSIHYHIVNPDNQSDSTATKIHQFLCALTPKLKD